MKILIICLLILFQNSFEAPSSTKKGGKKYKKTQRRFTEADTSKDFIDKYVCKSVNGFNFDNQTPKYRPFDGHCKEHGGNTCCLHKDDMAITARLNKYKEEGHHLS